MTCPSKRPNTLGPCKILAGIVLLAFFAGIARGAPPTSKPVSEYDDQPIQHSPPTTAPAATVDNFNVQRLLTAMAVVLTLIFGLRYAAGWLFPATKVSRKTRSVRVLARTTIAPRQQVMLLHVGRRVIVVGDSAGSLSLLGQIEDPDEVAELIGQNEQSDQQPAVNGRFGTLFGRAKTEIEGAMPAASETETEEPNVSAAELDDARGEISQLITRMRALTQTVRKE